MEKVELYPRADGKFGWRRWSGSDVVSTDGGQGYENKSDARSMAERLNPGVELEELQSVPEDLDGSDQG